MSKFNSDNCFFENLTVGLMKNLSNIPRILNINCEKMQPCNKNQINNWEQRHNVYLPEDMKKFYQSIDGFTMYWSYQYAPEDIRRVGYINLPSLLKIALLRENYSTLTASLNADFQLKNSLTAGLHLTTKTKIFELNTINDLAKVCLVYETTGLANPKIFILELNKSKWQYLADSFSEYLRMAVAHLGLRNWELCFSSFGIPPWTEQLFLLLAPHLLEENGSKLDRSIKPISETIYNQVDKNIFKIQFKLFKNSVKQ